MPAAIKALVVDDSAFARKVVREMLMSSPEIEVVGTARDGEEALVLVETLKPDIVICDLMMPKLDGVGFVRRQMARRPLPILVLSAAAADAEVVVEALNAGAIEVVRKPSALASDDLRKVRDELVSHVHAAYRIPVDNLVQRKISTAPVAPSVARGTGKVDMIVLGISTGGPQALRQMIPRLPADLPVPLAMVLHMPVGYTALYAEKLNEISQLTIKEVEDGDIMLPGHAYLALAGMHLTVRRALNGQVLAQTSMQPLDKIHRPSVDVLFRSAAETYRDRVLAVVMTGMGDDGKEGSAWIKAQGGTVITEAEKSCVIYGMPRSVAEAGLSDAAVTLDDMAAEILRRL